MREKDREKCLRRWGQSKIKREGEAKTEMRKMKRNESASSFIRLQTEEERFISGCAEKLQRETRQMEK